MNSFKRGDWL